jgi:hypothetical protein
MTWTYQGQIVEQLPKDIAGFVYLITCNSTGRMYVGKKLAQFKRTKLRVVKLKNGKKKKRKIRDTVESDWRSYYGSSKELTEDIAKLGQDQFVRQILHYCKSKAQCSYLELKEQILRGVLESEDYYNGHIQARIHKSHIKKLLTEG